MSNPQNPDDPDSLSLTPSASTKKADFSNVSGGSSTKPADGGDKADFSNVTGGASTKPDAMGAEQSYTVQKGDTLSHISRQFYGKASDWNRIFEANRDQLDNPDLIKPGQVLKIPG